MIMSEKQTAAVERKQRICDRYKGADTAEVEVIPAKPTEALEGKNTILRVAAYVRVSTDNDEQLTSYELQKNYYTDYISSHPGWVLAGIYADMKTPSLIQFNDLRCLAGRGGKLRGQGG